MSFLPIEKVRGEHLVDRNALAPIPVATRLVDPARLVASAGAPVESINWHMRGNLPVATVKTAKRAQLFDARTGAALPPLDADQAKVIALDAWRGGARPPATARRVTEEIPEYRGDLPAWRVAFADRDHTAVYVVADSGRIAAVRTGTWRLYDFFWGLHIMDWKNRENFNTLWLLGFALGGLVLGLCGTVLLFMRGPFRRRRATPR